MLEFDTFKMTIREIAPAIGESSDMIGKWRKQSGLDLAAAPKRARERIAIGVHAAFRAKVCSCLVRQGGVAIADAVRIANAMRVPLALGAGVIRATQKGGSWVFDASDAAVSLSLDLGAVWGRVLAQPAGGAGRDR